MASAKGPGRHKRGKRPPRQGEDGGHQRPALPEDALPPVAWRRHALWGSLLLLLLALLGTAMVLARQFQENQMQHRLEREAEQLVGDIRTGLTRNVQTLQSLNFRQRSPGEWEGPALEVLEQNREMAVLEWRDRQLRVLASRISPFHGEALAQRPRHERRQDVATACAQAKRTSAPAYSPSYFWPQGDGRGQEMMEMCLPKFQHGELEGYLVASYALPGLLSELLEPAAARGLALSLTEVDGTHLAMAGTRPEGAMLSAEHLLELPGHVLMLRIIRPRDQSELTPWSVTGLVVGMSALMLAVLALLARDMRLRLAAERGLAEALAFRQAMENSLVTGLRARDMQGRITYVNPAFCDMVGMTAGQLLGTSTPAPYWPADMVNEYQQRQAIRLAGQTLPREGFESVFVRSDGSRFPVLIIEAPLINAQGIQTGWMSAILDLTEQHQVEAQSRASQEKLQATARLAMLGEMASLLSHEINQPLSAIASYASGTLNLLSQPQADGTQAWQDMTQAMQRIREQAERAGRVTHSVSNFVRRRGQAQGLRREPVSPQALVQAILPLLNLQARKEGIRVVVDLPTDCPDALCDHTMVEQVLLNLARNGMQAMADDHPPAASGLRVLTIRAQPHASQQGKTWLMFSVTDHGIGLSPEVASQLFTPFFTTKPEGTGLGLSLCRTVVEQHGGALVHAPASPCGTVFRFTLPAVSPTAPVQASTA